MKKIKFELLKIANFLKKAMTYNEAHTYFENLVPNLERDFNIRLRINENLNNELRIVLDHSIGNSINFFEIHLLDLRMTREKLDKFHQSLEPIYQKKESPEKYKEHIENIYTKRVSLSIIITWEEEDHHLSNLVEQLRSQINSRFPSIQYSTNNIAPFSMRLRGSFEVSSV